MRLWVLTTCMKGQRRARRGGFGRSLHLQGAGSDAGHENGRSGWITKDCSTLTTTLASGGERTRKLPQAPHAAAVTGGARRGTQKDAAGRLERARMASPSREKQGLGIQVCQDDADVSGADPVPGLVLVYQRVTLCQAWC